MSEGVVRLTLTWLAEEVTRLISSPVGSWSAEAAAGRAQTSYLCDEVV
jgi:hypothetical protein